MSANYLYTHTIISDRKGEICSQNELTVVHKKHQHYIHSYLRPALLMSKCGWDDLRYLCVKYPNSDYLYPYMVLYVKDIPKRWIPVEGNNEACNLRVLGENIW